MNRTLLRNQQDCYGYHTRFPINWWKWRPVVVWFFSLSVLIFLSSSVFAFCWLNKIWSVRVLFQNKMFSYRNLHGKIAKHPSALFCKAERDFWFFFTFLFLFLCFLPFFSDVSDGHKLHCAKHCSMSMHWNIFYYTGTKWGVNSDEYFPREGKVKNHPVVSPSLLSIYSSIQTE